MLRFFRDILEIESTSGTENTLAEFIAGKYTPEGAELERHETPEGRINLYFKWGDPDIIFCSHLDTVPPYIPPRFENGKAYGRGTCDAKGQLAVLYETCRQLYSEGKTNFGLLMAAGEEDGSKGAKASNKIIKGCRYVIIGEPTENKLIKASKGTKLCDVRVKGRSCHSGYPEQGDNAALRLIEFLHKVSEAAKTKFAEDRELGKTTYNIGMLRSDNAFNVISVNAECRLYFRTTPETHDKIEGMLREIADENTEMRFTHGDAPMKFHTVPGFETDVVSYGTDAPSLSNLGKRMLYGPGSILNAHTEGEFIKTEDMKKAVEDLKKIFGLIREESVGKN
jgi:acetylornithine deacetylase